MSSNQSKTTSVKSLLSRRFVLVLAVCIVLVIGYLFFAGAKDEDAQSPLYVASSNPIDVPAKGLPFEDYVRQSEASIQAVLSSLYFSNDPQYFGESYSLDHVVSMRAPFELKDESSECMGASATGFLLLHGLTDSPFYLQDLAQELVERVPCAYVRAILLPGHGTVPGDTLDMRWQDWMAATDYGVEGFRGSVDELYLVGFSLGSSLALLHADKNRDDALLKGLILLSPAVRAANDLAYLSPYVNWVQKWSSFEQERDAARYETFSMNAAAQFYLLARQVEAASFAPLNLPVFVAATIDDATVNMESSIEFFCTKAPKENRQMIVYQAQTRQLQRQCEGIEIIEASEPSQRVFSLSHTGLTISSDNAHYGFDAEFKNCLHYGRGTQSYNRCFNDDAATLYAERNLLLEGELADKLLRRSSFNPHFAAMVDSIVSFISH